MKLSYITSLHLLLLIFGLALIAAPVHANPKYASMVMDADTGMILSQRYADKRVHPASLTKVMTLMMLFEAMDRGELTLNSRIRISKRAASMVPSKIGLPAGSSIRVKDAIYALVTKSANDIAVAVAEKLGKTESQFANMMTRRAREIGMRNTRFKNASGLHHKYQITTARDMAKLGRFIIKNHPRDFKYFSKKSFRYRGKTYKNHNKLLASYNGMDGFKTGYINASGYNLLASAERNNRRIIAVVFGGRTSKSRNAHMAKLLDYGFGRIGQIYVARAKIPPRPDRKPNIGSAEALLAMAENTMLNGPPDTLTKAERILNTEVIGKMVEQGDADPAISARIETGLLALNKHQNRGNETQLALLTPSSGIISPKRKPGIRSYGDWSIQIGAYSKRDKTEHAFRQALDILPPAYDSKQTIVAPLKTANGYVYRARLGGYTKSDAQKACSYFKDCLPIAP